MLARDKLGQYNAVVKQGKASAKKNGERERTLIYMREFKRRDNNENCLARPQRLHENIKLGFRGGNMELPQRGRKYTRSREEKKQMHRYAHVAKKQRVELIEWENVKYIEARDALDEKMGKIQDCDMQRLCTHYIGETSIEILEDTR